MDGWGGEKRVISEKGRGKLGGGPCTHQRGSRGREERFNWALVFYLNDQSLVANALRMIGQMAGREG